MLTVKGARDWKAKTPLGSLFAEMMTDSFANVAEITGGSSDNPKEALSSTIENCLFKDGTPESGTRNAILSETEPEGKLNGLEVRMVKSLAPAEMGTAAKSTSTDPNDPALRDTVTVYTNEDDTVTLVLVDVKPNTPEAWLLAWRTHVAF